MHDRRRTATLVAAVALVVASALAALQEAGSVASRLGFVAGTAATGLVMAVLLRFAWLRVRDEDRPLWAPSVLVVATVIVLVLAILRAGQQAREEQVACDPRARPAEQLVGRLPAGWRSEPAAREVVERARQVVEGEPRRLTAVSVLRGEEQLATVVAVEQDEPIGRRELVDGLESAGGRRGRDVPLGRAQGRLVSDRDGLSTVAGVSDECGAVFVFAGAPEVARQVAAGLAVRDAG